MGEKPLRILLLEDSAFDAELLREALRRSHPDVVLTWVKDEDGFVAALAPCEQDLILSDFQLPGYSGTQALDHAQQHCPHVPFIFVSGVIGEDNAVDLLKRGATDYVIKGRLSRLPLAIERALAEVEQRDARRAAETHLREAKEEAERANRAKDRFLAVLSHELRTPLMPIAAAAHVLERAATVPEQFRHLFPMIRRNVDIEARLIDDLLDLTALGAGKLRLQREPIDLHGLVQAVVEMLDADIERKQLRVVTSLAADRSTVDGDSARLQQVIWNLLRNAVKFTPEQGLIEVSTHRDGERLVLQCRDSGIGIDPQALPRLFLPFEQADAEVAQRFGGLGLGLAIAHGLVRRHEGDLSVHSDGRHRGATFTLRLPLFAPARQAAAADPAPTLPATTGQQPVRLLLVEDNADAADALALSLQQIGYTVDQVHSRHEALARIDGAAPYDLVITDLGLPDGSGIDIGHRLQGRLPVIALSGFGAPSDLRSSADAGFAGHLIKPVEPATVHAAVQAALAKG